MSLYEPVDRTVSLSLEHLPSPVLSSSVNRAGGSRILAMGLSSAVIWWEEWQLRILVLMSLFIQYILFFADLVRRGPGLRRLRVLVWIAYVSSDAVAIFALATLFNRHRHTCDEEGSNLEVLWVPVLIVHLAGQPNISAYSLEDNELWKRHIVTLVSQVTVALYVFCRWWSGDKAQLAAAILLFILGIFRLAQKPWALRIASFNSCQASNMVALPRAQREYTCEDYVQAAKRVARHGFPAQHHVLMCSQEETHIPDESCYLQLPKGAC
ncbi:hypothetical protein ACQJBY_045352 [Aegilops geniculata]